MLGVLRHHPQGRARALHALGVPHGHVERHVLQARLQLGRTHGAQRAHDARVDVVQHAHKTRGNRHAHGHGANVQLSAGRCSAALQLLLQQLVLAQHAPRAGQHAFPLGGKPGKIAPPRDDGHPQAFFERAQRVRQRGLRHMAGQCGTAKVALFIERQKVLERNEKVHADASHRTALGCRIGRRLCPPRLATSFAGGLPDQGAGAMRSSK